MTHVVTSLVNMIMRVIRHMFYSAMQQEWLLVEVTRLKLITVCLH